jgi:hypothetical protein
MIQTRFFTLSDRYAQREKLGDPLPRLNAIVDWETLRSTIERCQGVEERGSRW